MKLTVPVEIEWLEEGGTIDEAVQRKLIERVSEKVNEEVLDDLVSEAVGQINGKVDVLVSDLFTRLMNRSVPAPKNRWGERDKEEISLEDLIKHKIDLAFTEKVNSYGEPGYGDHSRLEWLLKKYVGDGVAKATKEIVAQIDARISATLSESIKANLGQSLLAKLDVDAVIKKAVGQLGEGR